MNTVNINNIIGIDEVGRGPIAGPVAVCAFKCQYDFFENIEKPAPLRDSKKLTENQREKWFTYLSQCKKEGKCDFVISYVSANTIDKFGIVKAITKALETSLLKVSTDTNTSVYLDGGLKAPAVFINQETIIKGDELHPVISCASIVAKVSRDRVMRIQAKEYPLYGFDTHVGYGTKAHYKAIEQNGLTPLHRRSFLKGYKEE